MISSSFSRLAEHPLLPACLVGALAGGLYGLITHGQLVGLLINFVPLMLMAALGLSQGFRAAAVAAGAAFVVLLFGAPEALPVYLVTEIAPLLMVLRLALTYLAKPVHDPERARQGVAIRPAFPMGWILSTLCLYAGGLLMLALLLSQQGVATGDLAKFIEDVRGVLKSYGANQADAARMAKSLEQYFYLFLGLMLWMWALSFWGAMAVAKYLAEAVVPMVPRSLALSPFAVPLPMLGLLALAGLGGMAAQGDMAQWLRGLFLLFLLPYFLSGFAQALARLPAKQGGRGSWVALMIASLILMPWAVVIFIAIGLVHPLYSRSPK